MEEAECDGPCGRSVATPSPADPETGRDGLPAKCVQVSVNDGRCLSDRCTKAGITTPGNHYPPRCLLGCAACDARCQDSEFRCKWRLPGSTPRRAARKVKLPTTGLNRLICARFDAVAPCFRGQSIVVGLEAVAAGDFPPDTVTVLVTLDGAFAATSVMAG
jgi:hypothetical protein